MTTLNLYNLLQECKVESDIEEKYKRVISRYFPDAKISSPYYTDGLLENGLKMLMEFKFKFDLTKRLQLVDLLIQLIYYLKKFENYGDELPTIIFGGDFDECFCLHSNDLTPYLNENLDWSIMPSEAPSKNPILAKKLYNDQNIKPYIFSINNERFDFKFVVDKIKQLHKGTIQKLRITELNINRFFSYFEDRIIKHKKKYSADDLVAIFLGCLIDSNNNYPHPKKKNLLVTTLGDISINRNIFNSFFEHFETNYSINEKKRLTAICDRLVADEARRFRGEFYTPTEWVLEAHKMIEEQFGPNWKEEYVVWDPAWGTGNLTRDFKFKELYCSTINYGDLNIGKHYNPGSVKFQYDFLNDDVTPDSLLPIDDIKKLPDGLVKAFEQDKPLIILQNPPFGRGTGGRFGIDTKGSTINSIQKVMINLYKTSSPNLALQFLFRIIIEKNKYKLTNIHICSFHPLNLLSASYYTKGRNIFLSMFNLRNCFMFDSSDFSDTSVISGWPCCFSIYNVGVENRKEIDILVKKKNIEKNIINGYKKLIINDKNMASAWIRENINYSSKHNGVIQKSILTLNHDKLIQNKYLKNHIGCFFNNGSYVRNSSTELSIFSGIPTYAQIPITTDNFDRSIAYYTARKTTILSLENYFDEYQTPSEEHPEYPQWNTDSIIYSTLHSNQSSLRKITYKDKIWDIKNEWFWMSNEQMLQLANENGFDELYHDATGDHDRFVFNKIKESSFSSDAVDVLNKANELVIKTFPYRQQLHEEHPEWHLHAWDAGWYQIKLILKKYFKDDLKEFNILYKEFENRMREGVYKFGFLKR